jgi:hypothetical protein
MMHALVLVALQAAHGVKNNGCGMSGSFTRIRAIVVRLDQEVGEADDIVKHLRHTTRGRPYKRIERAWEHIQADGDRALDLLSDIPPTLDGTPAPKKKAAALELAEAYRNEVEHLIDYAHTVALYERTQVALSTYMWRRQFLSFGVESDPNRARTDDIVRYQLDETANEATSAFTEARPLKRISPTPWYWPSGGLLDAAFGLKIAEHRYAGVCLIRRLPPILTAMRAV